MPIDLAIQMKMWQIALGWSLLTFVVIVLLAILLDLLNLRRLPKDFRTWVYGVFLVGLLGGASAWFAEVIKINPSKAAAEAGDQVADEVYTPPPPVPPPAPLDTSVDASRYSVFLQFAGLIRREDMIEIASELSKQGWRVQGGDRGGERTPAAANQNEVRYGSAEDQAAAAALADTVQRKNLSGKPIAIDQNEDIASNTLELWISR